MKLHVSAHESHHQSESITHSDTLLHMDRNNNTLIPTADQALLHRTAPPTTHASNQGRPAPPERVEHPT